MIGGLYMLESLGLMGMIFILLGWIISFKTIPDPKLSTLYGLGSFLLTIHAYLLGDMVFIVLNALATIISVVNIIRWFSKRKHE
ncbi:MAG: hypothetical protein DRJ35_03955 [Thermoprotei archaeon]|nr:MAG: hypothetical protein DRJ35_03955 [Thermoprotei archaeon]